MIKITEPECFLKLKYSKSQLATNWQPKSVILIIDKFIAQRSNLTY
jgi:hypothetical protein